MRIAFKEWAVVVDALGRGTQILILRKGGISESRGGFRPEHPQFLLFPTLFHQQRASVIPAAQARYDQIERDFPSGDRVRIEFLGEVVSAQRLESLAAVHRLGNQHIWRDEVIRQRFDWGKEQNIFALALRVWRLASAVELPTSSSYGGCRSWVELQSEMKCEERVPVLSNDAFALKLTDFLAALEPEPVK